MIESTQQVSKLNHAANLILKHKVERLQVIPTVAIKLLRLTNNEKTNVTDLSQLIETEPTLTAKVLRNVNSAAFGLSHKITSIKRSVNILGFSSVRELALNQLFYNKLINHKTKREFDQLYFWQHSLFVASLSRVIATTLKHVDPDLIYCAGLMHDIGKIVLETHGKVGYSEYLEAYKYDQQPALLSEQDFFGLNHAEMGYVFCQQWAIPEQIAAIVYHHHNLPDNESPFAKYNNDIAIVNFANYLAWMQGIGSTSHNNPTELHSEVSRYLNFEALDLELLLDLVDQEMQQTRKFYGIKFPSVNKLRASLVGTTLLLNHKSNQLHVNSPLPKNISLTSLTKPHQSLNPDEIIPWTLTAIHSDFNFKRLLMLNISPKQRILEAVYTWPEDLNECVLQDFSIRLDLLPSTILKSLRERKAIVVNLDSKKNKSILEQFKVDEFIIIPVLSQNRLIALLYADNDNKQIPIPLNTVDLILPIVHELGVALANAKKFEQEKKRAEIDSLTGLLNKRKMNEFLSELFLLQDDELSRIAVGFIDIDYFKNFNDSCGHQAGDNALKIVAHIMRTFTRPSDLIGRYGGEEFVFVLHKTDRQGALSYAERIRHEIERKGKILSRRFKGHALTVSIGVCIYKSSFMKYQTIIEIADKAMYKAKEKGRNCVEII